MFSFSGPTSEFTPADATRLRRVERKLDLILAHLNIPFAEESGVPEEVRHLADRGEKIPAIKAYRDATGAGLAEAKHAVEEYLAGRGGK